MDESTPLHQQRWQRVVYVCVGKLHSANFTAFIEADYALNKQLHVVLDVHGVHNIRNSKDVFSDPTLRPWYSHMSRKYRYFYSENSTLNQHFTAFNPRIGVVYNPIQQKDNSAICQTLVIVMSLQHSTNW